MYPKWVDTEKVPNNAELFRMKMIIEDPDHISIDDYDLLMEELRRGLETDYDWPDSAAWFSVYKTKDPDDVFYYHWLKLTAIVVPKEVIK